MHLDLLFQRLDLRIEVGLELLERGPLRAVRLVARVKDEDLLLGDAAQGADVDARLQFRRPSDLRCVGKLGV